MLEFCPTLSVLLIFTTTDIPDANIADEARPLINLAANKSIYRLSIPILLLSYNSKDKLYINVDVNNINTPYSNKFFTLYFSTIPPMKRLDTTWTSALLENKKPTNIELIPLKIWGIIGTITVNNA